MMERERLLGALSQLKTDEHAVEKVSECMYDNRVNTRSTQG